MSIDVNQNLDIQRQPDGQQPSATTSTPVQNQNNAGIFRVGLTADQAQAEGLNSLFTQYNTEDDGVISQSEFDTYIRETSNQEQQDIRSKSGQRTAIGGMYTVQAGDTLSKIAQDFGLTLVEIYEANKSVIGKDANKINVGLKLQVNLSQIKNEEHHDNDIEEHDCHNHSHNCSEEHEAAINNVIKFLNTAGIKVDQRSLAEIKEQCKDVPKEQIQAFVNNLVGRYIDMSKADQTLFDGVEDLLSKANMDIQDFRNSDPRCKGSLLAKALNANLALDLDENNTENRYNKTLQRLRESGLSETEKQYFKNYDLNNLSDQDYENIAKSIVTQTYQATIISTIHQKLQGNENDNAKLFMHGFMESYLSDANLNNNLMILANTVGTLNEDDLKEISNDFLKFTKSNGNTNAEDETLAIELAMQYGDKESIETFIQNNQHLQEKIANIANYVAENTTDETRKAMLNNIAENASSIAQGSTSAIRANSTGSPGSSSNINGMTNPVQQNFNQVTYINNLRQASENFHNQNIKNSDSEIPAEYRSAFSSVQEYLDFDGSGMLMSQYKQIKSELKNNFTEAMNNIIENYEKLPAKLKTKLLELFSAMDNNTSGELYIEGSDDVRAFMDKYNYMTPEKLSQYAQLHPSEIKNATKKVQLTIEELQEQEQKVQ